MGSLSLGRWVVNFQACAVNELDRNVREFPSDAGRKLKNSPILHYLEGKHTFSKW